MIPLQHMGTWALLLVPTQAVVAWVDVSGCSESIVGFRNPYDNTDKLLSVASMKIKLRTERDIILAFGFEHKDYHQCR